MAMSLPRVTGKAWEAKRGGETVPNSLQGVVEATVEPVYP